MLLIDIGYQETYLRGNSFLNVLERITQYKFSTTIGLSLGTKEPDLSFPSLFHYWSHHFFLPTKYLVVLSLKAHGCEWRIPRAKGCVSTDRRVATALPSTTSRSPPKTSTDDSKSRHRTPQRVYLRVKEAIF